MLHELLECLGGIDDPREPAKAEHRLVDVRAIAVCAVLAHAESFEDIALYGRSKRAWLGRFLELPGGIPSHDTLRRVLMLIDPGGFERGFLAWTRRAFVSDGGDDEAPPQIAVDGKALRRSFDRRRERTPLHPARAFATRSGLVLAQRRVAERRALHGAVRAWLDARAFAVSGDLRPCSDTWDDQHGRLVRRRVLVADAQELPDAAEPVAARPGLRRVVAVKAIRSVANPAPNAPRGVSCQSRCYLTSSAAPEERVAAAVRAHWAIENRLHGVLDTGFGEDLSRVRDRNAAATSPCCAASPSTSCAPTEPRPAASRESANAPPGTTPSCTAFWPRSFMRLPCSGT